jgi:hypothetical protein
MASSYKILLAVIFSLALSPVWAQQGKPASTKATAQKFKPPKLFTTLGTRTDSVTVGREQAIAILVQPLVVMDEKKSVYSISSYQCLYKRQGVTEDEQTGKVTPASSSVTELFRTTPLPDLWTKTLTEQLRPGEELFFYDVIVQDAAGRLMFVPTFRIKVK